LRARGQKGLTAPSLHRHEPLQFLGPVQHDDEAGRRGGLISAAHSGRLPPPVDTCQWPLFTAGNGLNIRARNAPGRRVAVEGIHHVSSGRAIPG
jgi:hypothetical protein